MSAVPNFAPFSQKSLGVAPDPSFQPRGARFGGREGAGDSPSLYEHGPWFY